MSEDNVHYLPPPAPAPQGEWRQVPPPRPRIASIAIVLTVALFMAVPYLIGFYTICRWVL